MPTYVVTTSSKRLAQEQKNKIAEDITQIHCDQIGVSRYFVQIIFNEVSKENYFLGGKQLSEDNIYIHAHIRNGRTLSSKQSIINDIVTRVASASDADISSIQTYITDIPASQVAEFGTILPEPGEEDEWEKQQSEVVRARMRRLS